MKKTRVNIRAIFMFMLISGLLITLIARIAFIETSETALTAIKSDTKTTLLGTSRGYIYDRNMKPLVNSEFIKTAAVIALAENNKILDSISDNKLSFVNSGALITAEVKNSFNETKTAKCFDIVNRYSDNMLLSHIIGYTNDKGAGVCGLEKSYDKILSSAGGSLSVSVVTNAAGGALAGAGISVNNQNYNSLAGLVLTIDADIQNIAEKALEDSEIKTGACVVINPNTGEILALASVPEYSVNNLSHALKNNDKPFLNRVLSAYPVGSVFKPFIAAAALESEITLPKYICNGYTIVGDTRFNCYLHRAHGNLNITGAVCNSCNCYFIELGLKTGAQEINSVCSAFGFGKAISLTSDIVSSAGVLPDVNSLKQSGCLANLCFGQGELLATPLQLAAAYSVFANGGTYIEPYLLNKLVDENKTGYAYYKTEVSYRVLSEENCRIINEALYYNMIDGTGKNGLPDGVTACGKTATAQTGRYYENGNEQLCTWFAGFFPFQNPLYTVVVFNEDGKSASLDCAPVFKSIVHGILQNEQN